MSQLYELVVAIFRIARYGAADEFNDADESKERQDHAIPLVSDKKLKDARPKSQGQNSNATRKAN